MAKKKASRKPPKIHVEFLKYWNKYIDDVLNHPDFREVFLYHLEILCDMHCEYKDLVHRIQKHGYTFTTKGRAGNLVKTRPEVSQLNYVRKQIAMYTRLLGLALSDKKNDMPDLEDRDEEDEKDGW